MTDWLILWQLYVCVCVYRMITTTSEQPLPRNILQMLPNVWGENIIRAFHILQTNPTSHHPQNNRHNPIQPPLVEPITFKRAHSNQPIRSLAGSRQPIISRGEMMWRHYGRNCGRCGCCVMKVYETTDRLVVWIILPNYVMLCCVPLLRMCVCVWVCDIFYAGGGGEI